MSEESEKREPSEAPDREGRRRLVLSALASGPVIMSLSARRASAQASGPCYDDMGDPKICS